MELQQLHVLSNDVGRSPALLIPPQLVINLHDVRQLVRQIILTGREKGGENVLNEVLYKK